MLILCVVGLLFIPEALVADMDQAACDQHVLTRRVCSSFRPGWYRFFVLQCANLTYINRAFLLPAIMCMATCVIFITNPLNAASLLMNSLALLFVASLDDSLANFFVLTSHKEYVAEVVEGINEESTLLTAPYLLLGEGSVVPEGNAAAAPPSADDRHLYTSFVQTWASRRCYAFLLGIYIVLYICTGAKGVFFRGVEELGIPNHCGDILLFPMQELGTIIAPVFVFVESVVQGIARARSRWHIHMLRALGNFVVGWAILYVWLVHFGNYWFDARYHYNQGIEYDSYAPFGDSGN